MSDLSKTLKNSSTIKLITIIFITIAMLIPLTMVENTIHERTDLRHQAETSISDRWGGKQHIAAPILVLPYKEKVIEKTTTSNGWQTSLPIQNKKIHYVNHTAYLLSDNVNIETEMTTEKRYLGIYEMPVYNTSTKISGHFNKKDLETLKSQFTNIDWQQAKLILPLKDVRGIRSISKLSIGRQDLDFVTSNNSNYSFHGIEADIKFDENILTNLDYSLELSLSGSKLLNYLPLARTSNISINSDWNSPSFIGSYLPVNRDIDESGFNAQWKVLALNRSFGKIWHDDLVNSKNIYDSLFGISLYQPADIYQQNMRSVKYAALFIALTFMAFFLFEIFFNLNIHPIQYFFTGGALSTFYLLLLAMSEHLHFSYAYLISSIAITVLMSSYSMAILNQKSRGLLIGLVTSTIYGFLYFLIKSEQNSLLFGAIGFFSALSIIMYLTRNIDWYNLSSNKNRTINT